MVVGVERATVGINRGAAVFGAAIRTDYRMGLMGFRMRVMTVLGRFGGGTLFVSDTVRNLRAVSCPPADTIQPLVTLG